MQTKKKCFILHKISIMMSLVMILELVANFSVKTVQAQEKLTTSPVFSDVPFTEASKDKSLPSSSQQSSQIELLGLSSEQPSRLSSSGKEVDKNKNPLGPDTVVINRNYQLAYTYDVANQDELNLYDNVIGQPKISFNHEIASNTSDSNSSLHKKVVAVDVDGNGRQEVATLELVYDTKNQSYSLQLFLSDYQNLESNGKALTSKKYIVDTYQKYPGEDITYVNDPIQCAAGDFNEDGKEEIAIAIGTKLYLYKVTMSSIQSLSSITYASLIGDLEALDTDQDCFPELCVTTDANQRAATLNIYDKTDLSSCDYSIELALGDMKLLTASVDMGDLFGDGENTIVLGGKSQVTKGKSSKTIGVITSIKYHSKEDQYDKEITKIYSMLSDSDTSFQAIRSAFDIKCVSLATPIAGTPESIVFGGYIFDYDKLENKFQRASISPYSNDSSGTKKGNNAKKAEDNITDVNHDKDKTYILETIVGNFDGNTLGREQILLLHYNHWYDKEVVYITQCYQKEDGTITANLKQIYEKKKNIAYPYPSITEVDVLNHSSKLKFLPEESVFVYSNPIVTAVLGASPYYKELEDITTALGNVDTTFGTGAESEQSIEQGTSVMAGISFGFNFEVSFLFTKLFELEMETEIKSSLTSTYSTVTSVSKDISYSNYYSEDAVVLTVIPYDVYVYEATVWNALQSRYETGTIVMQIPYTPMTSMMTVDNYRKAAEQIPDAPMITSEVLQHNAGDPRSYPRTSKGLSNVSEKSMLMAGKDEQSSFIGSGIGNSSVEQSITSKNTSSVSYDFEFTVESKISQTIGVVKTGVSGGFGLSTNVIIRSSKYTTRSGSVASVPSAYSQYQFNWALVAYEYNLKAGDGYQKCNVINYICKPVGNEYPPKAPENLSLEAQGLNFNKISFKGAEGAAGYTILRSNRSDEPYQVLTSVAGKDNTTFTDTTIQPNQNYYYKVKAYNSKLTIASKEIIAPTLQVVELQVKEQPKLSYEELEILDLSALILTMVLSNNSSIQVNYSDFDKYNLSTSLENGMELDETYHGSPITIKYLPNLVTTNTNRLMIKANNPYPITLKVNFMVGSTSKALILVPGKQLKAVLTMENTTKETISAVVTLALYDSAGTMVNYKTTNQSMKANETVQQDLTLTLPFDVTGYMAKVFVWDGTSLSNSNLIPLTQVVQIPEN